MGTWLGRMPSWAMLFLLAAVASVSVPADDQIAGWVRDLAADDFAIRERASRQLAAAGSAAVEPLTACVVKGTPEAQWRAAAALDEITAHNRDARRASALSRFSELGGRIEAGAALGLKTGLPPAPVVIVPPAFLGDSGVGRALQAVERIAQLPAVQRNAVVPPNAVTPLMPAVAPPAPSGDPAPPPDRLPPENAPAGGGLVLPHIADAYVSDQFAPDDGAAGGGLPASEMVTIDRHWRGGDAGLEVLQTLPGVVVLTIDRAPVTDAALERIAALPKLTDLSIHGTALTAKALAKFRQRRPDVRVFATGEAMLGALANAAGPCVLVGVEPNSAAAEADLLAGDVLVALDGSPIRDLSDLTIALFEKKAGHTVSLELMRGGQRRTVSIALKPRAF